MIDSSQAIVPGVTVTATSPSLMGTRATVTDSDGQYRFTAVPPGDYTLLFELPASTWRRRTAG